jgi:hypothetical protein
MDTQEVPSRVRSAWCLVLGTSWVPVNGTVLLCCFTLSILWVWTILPVLLLLLGMRFKLTTKAT